MNSNKIKLNNIIKNSNTLNFDYIIEGEIKKYFNPEKSFELEYDFSIEEVPFGINVIPFLANILPICWLTDAEVYIEEIDESFYNSIPQIKKGYEKMFPAVEFKGQVVVNKIVNYDYFSSGKSVTFFSGGVDSTSTLITKLKEKPDLVTLWGSDIKLTDIAGWQNVKKELTIIGEEHKLNNIFIKSNFRTFILEDRLNLKYSSILKDNWWHGLQHSIGIISHVAPYAFLNKVSDIYFPATHNNKETNVVCASYPTIDNAIKIASSKVEHEGFTFDRQDKIQNICNYQRKTKEKINLRVCYSSTGGKNCGRCEKCARTIMGIVAEGEDPNNYEFDLTSDRYSSIENNVRNKWYFTNQNIYMWESIQTKFQLNRAAKMYPQETKWIMEYNFNKVNNSLKKQLINTGKSQKQIKSVYLFLKNKFSRKLK